MPILKLDQDEAEQYLKKNPLLSRWALPNHLDAAQHAQTARERIKAPVLHPKVKPKFKINNTDAIFALGSCFARETEATMVKKGMNVISHTDVFDSIEFNGTATIPTKDGVSTANFYANKFTIGSMLDEVRWAANTPPIESHPAIYEVSPGKFIDLASSNKSAHQTENSARKRRSIMSNLMRNIFEADIVILTLGLSEEWRHKDTQISLIDAPKTFAPEGCEDFELCVLSYSDVFNGLKALIDLLNQHGKPNWRMLLTVSPVPLLATFTGEDIITANSYSKSVLRAAAEEIKQAYDNIDYFPSYEMAMYSSPDAVWKTDMRHVKAEFVAEIVTAFETAYMTHP